MKKRFLKALQDKDFSEIFNKGSMSFLMRVGGQIIGFIFTFIIARFFGAKGLGDYVLAIIVLRIFSLISKLGMDIASIRFIASFSIKQHWNQIIAYRKQVIRILGLTTIILSLIMYFFAEPIALLIGAKTSYIQLNAFFIFPMSIFILNYQSLRGLKKIATFSFFNWISRLFFSTIIILIAVQFSLDDRIPIFAFLLGLILAAVASQIIFKINIQRRLKNNKVQELLSKSFNVRSILIVSLPLMFAQSGQFVMAWTDKLMLGGMIDSHEVGIYDVAFKLSMVIGIALTSVTSITSPKFAEVYANNEFNRLEKVVHQATKLTVWSSLPICFILLLLSPNILGLFGNDFQEGQKVFFMLCFARLITAFLGPAANLLQMTGRQKIYMNVLIVGAIINLGLNLILIPENNLFSDYGISGIEGAAVASTCSLIFWNLAMVFYAKREFGFWTIYNPVKVNNV
jgi:O-antigen/teichoic acid export membrane protein